jgi:hypothetical protein
MRVGVKLPAESVAVDIAELSEQEAGSSSGSMEQQKGERILGVIVKVCFWRDNPQLGQAILIHEVSRSHTMTHRSR